MNGRFSHMNKISVAQWPSDVGLPAAIKAATSQAAPLFPPLLQETLYRETQHVGGSARTAVPLSHLPLSPDGAQPLYRGKIPFFILYKQIIDQVR